GEASTPPPHVPVAWAACGRRWGRACSSARSPGTGRNRPSVAETPPTRGVPASGRFFAGEDSKGPRNAPASSLRRALGGLNNRLRPLNQSPLRLDHDCAGLEAVG